jgi:hypothetical protein
LSPTGGTVQTICLGNTITMLISRSSIFEAIVEMCRANSSWILATVSSPSTSSNRTPAKKTVEGLCADDERHAGLDGLIVDVC